MARSAIAPPLPKKAVALNVKAAARSGAYGAAPFERVEENAAELLRVIGTELAGVDWLTREDLLQTSAFQWCATITRYRYIAEAVTRLLETKRLVAVSRTELALPGMVQRHHSAGELAEEFAATVRKLVLANSRGGSEVAIPDVVAAWRTDEHLSRNVKRVVSRSIVARLARDGLLRRVGPGRWQREA